MSGVIWNRFQVDRSSRRVLKWIIGLTLAESFIYKSIAEELLGSTPLHYIISGLLCLSLGIAFIALRLGKYWPKDPLVVLGIVLLVGWSAVTSPVHSPVLENCLAAAFFGVLVVTFFVLMPLAAEACRLHIWRAVYVLSTVAVVASIIAFATIPEIAFDEEGGRFRGVLVSTAVASNVFLLGVLFSAIAIFRARSVHSRVINFLVLVASFSCLALTATRGALAFAAIGLLWIGLWKRTSVVLHKVVATLAAVTIVVLGVVMITDVAPALRDAAAEFLRWEQLSTAESRTANWLFGIERVLQAPVLGEGLLSKYTAGGTEEFGGFSGDSYDQFYDPHSVLLYLMTVGGIPLFLMMGILIVAVWRRATQSIRRVQWLNDDRRTLYMSTVVLFALMVVNGGSLVSFGNLVDRVWWVLLGDLYLQSQRVRVV